MIVGRFSGWLCPRPGLPGEAFTVEPRIASLAMGGPKTACPRRLGKRSRPHSARTFSGLAMEVSRGLSSRRASECPSQTLNAERFEGILTW